METHVFRLLLVLYLAFPKYSHSTIHTVVSISEKELHKGETVHEFTKDMQQAAVRSCHIQVWPPIAVEECHVIPRLWDFPGRQRWEQEAIRAGSEEKTQ